MDGPNVRPEAGFGAELNQPHQQAGGPPSGHGEPHALGSRPDPEPIAVPEAISFRQLAALRQSALGAERSAGPTTSPTPPASTSPAQESAEGPGRLERLKPQPAGAELADLEHLLGAYEQLGQRLLHQLSRQGTALEQHRHPQQVMALGALGAHIRLGLQALAASRQ